MKRKRDGGDASMTCRFSPLKLMGLTLGVAACLGVMSCRTTDDAVLVNAPNVPGATFVGSSACSECHADLVRDFRTADHARLQARGTNAMQIGCEGCHGPGSVHAQTGGGFGSIVNPRKSPEACFNCHLDKRGEFHLPNHHPVLEGRVSCVDCHNPHKGSAIAGRGISLLAQQEECTRCHTSQRGPFVFPHEALREGCTSCHNPHGSVNNKLLTARNANLCLKCHFQQQGPPERVRGRLTQSILIGGEDHSTFLTRGTCWGGGCHEAVHGSRVSPLLRF